MDVSKHNKKPLKGIIDDEEKLKLWLIPEIYGWLIIISGFGIFVMLVVAAVALFMISGLSIESLWSLVQLVEGVTIGGGFIAFGAALRKFVVVQATLLVIFLLITIWFLWFFGVYGERSDFLKILLIAFVVISPLAVCIFVNRKRFDN